VWVVGSIRVRVVDQRVRRGALYNRKGVVVDTGGAGEFALLMDDDGKLTEGISQKMVESALPKQGGNVLIVRGPHRGRRGRLLERDSRKDRAVVTLNGDFSIVTFGFDDVCEWAGSGEDAEDEF
jgi:G patch domain/KOW motif-containing protein